MPSLVALKRPQPSDTSPGRLSVVGLIPLDQLSFLTLVWSKTTQAVGKSDLPKSELNETTLKKM